MEIGMGGMNMDINMDMNVRNDLSRTQSVGGNAQPAGVSRASALHGGKAPAELAASDQAQLSSAASLAAQAAALPDVRMDKVAAMQSAIANGYHVSSSDVAGAMMNHMLNRSE